jgi:hypothetical protein
MNWIGEFFRAIPDAFVAWWEFSGGLFGLAVLFGSIALLALFTGLAYQLREQYGWLSALFGSLAAMLALWWLMGIVPSAWVYFVDAEQELLAGRLIPEAIVLGDLEVASDFYNVFRDSVVMVMGTVVLVGVFWFALAFQKRFPKSLAEGEDRGPTTGGYK